MLSLTRVLGIWVYLLSYNKYIKKQNNAIQSPTFLSGPSPFSMILDAVKGDVNG
jgi:hypothetical protein